MSSSSSTSPTSVPSTIRASSSTPDFHHGSTTLALLLLLTTLPFYLICLYLLLRRRRMYPIAGRGSTLLLLLCALSIVINIFSGSVGLAYSDGLPCTMTFLVDYLLAIPASMIYILRGWILVFRIEIMNYLEERRWRQEKADARRGEGKAVAPPSPSSPRATLAVAPLPPSSPRASMRIAVLPSLLSIDENGDRDTSKKINSSSSSFSSNSTTFSSLGADSTIPGFWFITHRRYISWTFLRRIISIVSVIFLIFFILLLARDPDLKINDKYSRNKGEIGMNDSITDESLFGRLTFFNTPECPPVSIKIWVIGGFLLFLVFPIVLWSSWRIWLDSRRRRKRMQEKLAVAGVQLISGASSPSSSTSSDLELDDTPAVKTELFRIVIISLVSMFSAVPAKSFARTYIWTIWYLVTITHVWISIVSPLRISFALSKKLRERRHNGSTIPPHRQAYYQLDYILANPTAYSALLTFLQKEHSSENILFLSAAQKFTSSARQLEHATQWPSEPLYSDAEISILPAPAPHHQSFAFNQTRSIISHRLPPIIPSVNMKRTLVEIPNDPLSTATAAGTVPPFARSPSSSSTTRTISLTHLMHEAQRLKSLSAQIQHQYFDASAVYEVNLPQRVATLITARSRQLTAEWDPTTADSFLPPPFPLSTLYREVYTEVYRLIEKDSFRRFVLTPAFDALLTKADELEAHQLEHQPDLVAETAQVVEHAAATLANERRTSMEHPLLDLPLLHERARSSSASGSGPASSALSPISRQSPRQSPRLSPRQITE